MNEMILTYRNTNTNQLLHAHVCNTGSDQQAWDLVQDNVLDSDNTNYHFESLHRLSPNSSVVPF